MLEVFGAAGSDVVRDGREADDVRLIERIAQVRVEGVADGRDVRLRLFLSAAQFDDGVGRVLVVADEALEAGRIHGPNAGHAVHVLDGGQGLVHRIFELWVGDHEALAGEDRSGGLGGPPIELVGQDTVATVRLRTWH